MTNKDITALVKKIESSIGYKLPTSYIDWAAKNPDGIGWEDSGNYNHAVFSLNNLNSEDASFFAESGEAEKGIIFLGGEGEHVSYVFNYNDIKKNNEPSIWQFDDDIGSFMFETFEEFIAWTNIQGQTDEFFEGKKVCVTGTMQDYTRADIQELLEEYGAEVVSSVSKNTDVLIVGEKAGSKLTKAKELGITIMTEQQFKTWEEEWC